MKNIRNNLPSCLPPWGACHRREHLCNINPSMTSACKGAVSRKFNTFNEDSAKLERTEEKVGNREKIDNFHENLQKLSQAEVQKVPFSQVYYSFGSTIFFSYREGR